MAGTVLDSLVIKLALDAGAVTTGAKKAATSLKTLENSAGHTQNTLRDTGKAAADSFAKARIEIVAMLALLTGGRSLKQAFSEVTTANAQLGNVAQNLNMDPRKLWAYGQMLDHMGGKADEAAAAVRKMQAMAYDPAQNAALSKIMIGLNTKDYLNPDGTLVSDILRRINKGVTERDQHGNLIVNQSRRNHFLPEAGIGSDAFRSMEELDPNEYDRRFNFEQANGPSREDIARAQHLKETIGELRDQTGKYGRDLVSELTPGLDMWLSKLMKIEAEHSKITGVISNLTSVLGAASSAASTLATILGPLLAIKSIRQIAELKAAATSGETVEAEAAVAGGGSTLLSAAAIAVPAVAGMAAWKPTAAGGPVEQWAQRHFGDNSAVRWFFGDHEKGSASQALAILQNQGFSRNAALGIVGNIAKESRFDPNARGDNGQAVGLGQWHPDRVSEILKGTGIDVQNASFEDQVKAYAWELQHGTDAGARKAGRILNDPNITAMDATHAVRAYDERPADRNGSEDYERYMLAAQAASLPQAPQNNTHHEYHINVTAQPGADGQQIARDIQHELHYAMPYPLLTSQG